jgi:hypothetical protein
MNHVTARLLESNTGQPVKLDNFKAANHSRNTPQRAGGVRMASE